MDGLFRSTATARDRVRRRVLAVTTVTGVAGVATVGGLLVGLVPAGAGQAVPPRLVVPTADPTGSLPAGVAAAPQPPVATSGAS